MELTLGVFLIFRPFVFGELEEMPERVGDVNVPLFLRLHYFCYLIYGYEKKDTTGETVTHNAIYLHTKREIQRLQRKIDFTKE